MCGLIGYVGKKAIGDGQEVVHQLMLESSVRGTDGWGYAAHVLGKTTKLYKIAESVRKAKLSKVMDVGEAIAIIGHTRAATSGTKGTRDCHPLKAGDVVVVHNGHVSNDDAIREEFSVPSDTPEVDSFLIAWLISQEKDVLSGIESVYKHCSGDLNFLVFSPRSPHTIWACSNRGTLRHISMAGRDYLVSTPEIFKRAMFTEDKWGISVPAHKISHEMRGVYEVSPYRISIVFNEKQVSTWQGESKPWKTKYVYQSKRDTNETKSTIITIPKEKTTYVPPTLALGSGIVGGECLWKPGVGEAKPPIVIDLVKTETKTETKPVTYRRPLHKRERKRLRRYIEYMQSTNRAIGITPLYAMDGRPPCETCDDYEAAADIRGVKACVDCTKLLISDEVGGPDGATIISGEELNRVKHVIRPGVH